MSHPRRTLLTVAFLSSNLMVTTAAGLTEIVGRLPGWVGVLFVVGLVAAMLWQLGPGTRRLPLPVVAGAFGLMLGSAYALQADERYALLALPLAVLAFLGLRRAPLLPEPSEPQLQGGTPALAEPAPVTTPPGPTFEEPARPGAAPPFPAPDSASRQPAYGPVSIELAPQRTRLLILLAGAGCLLLGSSTLWSAAFATNGLSGTGERVMGGLVGAMFTGLSLFLLLGGLTIRPQQLQIDAAGIRRTGPRGWDLSWTQVSAVGIRVRERSRLAASRGTGINRRRRISVLLLLEGAAPAALQAESQAPFSHHDDLPDLHPTQELSPTVIALDRGLLAHVPRRYLGVLQD